MAIEYKELRNHTRMRPRLGTHLAHSASFRRLRQLVNGREAKSAALIAVVEGIHDRALYDQYATANSKILTPFMPELLVASRKFVTDQKPKFRTLFAPPGADSAIDRVPVVFSHTDAVLQWVSCSEYTGVDTGVDPEATSTRGNLAVRHRASGHAQVYACWSAADDLIGGRPLNVFAQTLQQGPVPVAVIEGFSAGDAAWAELTRSIERRGLERLLHAEVEGLAESTSSRSLPPPSSSSLTLLEGEPTERLAMYRIASRWEETSELEEAFNAIAEARATFEAAGGRARCVSFEVSA
jgi:hypothetical protein